MKARFLFLAVMAVMMVFTGCTKEKIVYVEKESTEDVSELQLGEGIVKISLSENSSRAARPITGSEADHNINRIAFKLISNDGEVQEGWSIMVVDKDGEEIDYNDNGGINIQNNIISIPSNYFSSSEDVIYVKFIDLPSAGLCNLIAYGYNCEEDGVIDFPYDLDLFKASKGYCLQASTTGKTIEEIFAGYDEVYLNSHGLFTETPKITLERQVAGLLAYFSNVPAFVGTEKVDKITVRTYVEATGFKFPAQSDFNGVGNQYEKGVDLLVFDMSQATNYNDKYLSFGDTYKFGTEDKPWAFAEGVNISDFEALVLQEENTLFGSCFILPFFQHLDLYVFTPVGAESVGTTLQICFFKEDGTLLKNIPLRNGGEPNTDYTDADLYQFDIRCNHFYSLGEKSSSVDKPLDINQASGYDRAEVNVSESWALTHSLVTPSQPSN